MQRYKIIVEYDGTPFVGWQFQKNGLSIQEILQKAILQLSREKVTVTGAGRTDAGVHALAQVAHFDLKKKIKKNQFLLGANHYLRKNPVTN
jgi:tRNA pseudouridine38-40 synthase